jgi:hypothetical protein
LAGDPSLRALEAGCDAGVAIALLVGLGPGQVAGFGGHGDGGGGVDRGGGLLDSWWGLLGRFGLGGCGLDFGLLGLDGLLGGLLKLAEVAFGFGGFPAEADGTAPEAEDACYRYVRRAGLGQSFERLEAEDDDVGGEAEFVWSLRVVGGEHLGCGVAGGGWVTAGAGQEEGGETDQDGFQDGGWEGCREGCWEGC